MPKTPSATYRLQLHKGFTFDQASAIADYLWQLGVSHAYSSPYLQAAPGSMHGYDVVDHRKVNEELGGAEAHARYCKTLGENGLGQVLDIVPNHMSLGEQNRYWWDVLENGASSRYASFFDIDWNSSEERLREKVLVPILSDQYGRVLKDGGITVKRQGGSFIVEASQQPLPVAPESLLTILGQAANHSHNDILGFLADSYGRLPKPAYIDRRTVLARYRDITVLRDLVEWLCAQDDAVCRAIDRALRELNDDADALDAFLNAQHYRLAYWKAADQQLGYRRFFDVNTLIGLRVEREYVFDETHQLIVRWLRKGVLDGIRIDHPDGLRDPLQYCQRLRKCAPEAWIIAEKILEPGEFLRENWPIQGTSGYDFLNAANGLLVIPAGVKRLGQLYAEFTGDASRFPVVAHDKKIAVEQEALGSDVNRLANILVAICEDHREQRDYTLAEMRRAIREIAACFSVYRTYVVPRAKRDDITEEDRTVIKKAIECAKNNRTDIDPAFFDFIADILTLEVRSQEDEKAGKTSDETEFVLRFQQFTSPVMAKGVEDTAFYCYNRLTGLNEVGSDPARDGLTLKEFHEYNAVMQRTHPGTMTTLSTHDTKRSDDVRARLAVLSEIPDRFTEVASRWSEMNSRFRSPNGLPDRGTEWFLFQTLVGAWPISSERLAEYMQKAMREAKLHTSWVNNNAEYEDAVKSYIENTLRDEHFVADVDKFVAEILLSGRINSLTQTLLKSVCPGVPDLYQGSELWDLSLVDPDNRRPVDYDLRRKLLLEVHKLDAEGIVARMDEGLPKLWLVHIALRLRRENREWFGPDAGYKPLPAHGTKASHAVAVQRGEHVIAVAPLHNMTLGGDWGDTFVHLPKGTWTNRLTGDAVHGGNVPVATLLQRFPVALLTREN